MSPTQLTPTAFGPSGCGFATRSIPWRGETAYGGVPEYQSSSTVFASGPTTASERIFFRSSGSSPAEFLSSTIDWRVTSRTRARVSGCAQGSGSPGAPIRE